MWKAKGGDEDELNDAWLGEVDSSKESDAKVKKRKLLLEQQIDVLQQQDEAPPDVPELTKELVGMLQPRETVAAALRRLGANAHGVGRGRGRGRQAAQTVASTPAESVEQKSHRRKEFERLTDIADKLLRAGKFDVYSDTREKLAGGTEPAGEDASPEAQEEGAPRTGAQPDYKLDETSGCYFSASTGLYFDPRTSLYWAAGSTGPYFQFDGAQFVQVEMPSSQATAESAVDGDMPKAQEGVDGAK